MTHNSFLYAPFYSNRPGRRFCAKKSSSNLHEKNNASVMDLNTVEQWTAEAVSEYFESLGTPFKDYAKAFLEKDIDGQSLLGLVETGASQITEQIIPNVGHRLKILRTIHNLAREQENASIASPPASSSAYSQPKTGAKSLKRKIHTVNVEEIDDKPADDLLPAKKARTSSTGDLASTSRNIVGKTSEIPTFSKRPWPCPFVLPVFPPHVKSELEKSCYASRKIRLQVVRILYDHILQFTEHPSQDQRREVCIALINKYPGQQDATGGYDSWLNFLTNKFKNEIYHLTPKAKRTSVVGDQKGKGKVKKELQRGIIHWQPPPQMGENEESNKVHMAWLQKESKKEEKDKKKIKEKMTATYAFRRVYINQEKRPILEIARDYPCLFDQEEVCNEFARLMADESILESGINRLLQLTPRILHYARQKKSNPLIKDYLKLLDQEDDGMADNNDESDTDITDEEKSLVALLCLPLLLEKETKKIKKPQEFFIKVVASREQGLEEAKKDAPPSILIVGTVLHQEEIMIIGEGEVMLSFSAGDHLKAIKALISFYYTLNFCYPKACLNTFTFIQKYVLRILDSNHTPVTVTVFVNEISQ